MTLSYFFHAQIPMLVFSPSVSFMWLHHGSAWRKCPVHQNLCWEDGTLGPLVAPWGPWSSGRQYGFYLQSTASLNCKVPNLTKRLPAFKIPDLTHTKDTMNGHSEIPDLTHNQGHNEWGLISVPEQHRVEFRCSLYSLISTHRIVLPSGT